MKLKKVINLLEEEYPQELQFDWDSSGLLIERDNVSKVLVCLDVTNEVLSYAKDNCFDFIISHHPLIFGNYYTSFEYIRDIFQNLYASKISYYSMHTNFDVHNNGMNDLFLNQLEYDKLNDNDINLVTFKPDSNLINKLKTICHDKIRIYNNHDNFKKGAIVLGSGGSFIEDVNKTNCDIFISSEFKHHEILYAKEYNITLVDVAHQAEMIFVDAICNLLKSNFSELVVEPYYDYYKID